MSPNLPKGVRKWNWKSELIQVSIYFTPALVSEVEKDVENGLAQNFSQRVCGILMQTYESQGRFNNLKDRPSKIPTKPKQKAKPLKKTIGE